MSNHEYPIINILKSPVTDLSTDMTRWWTAKVDKSKEFVFTSSLNLKVGSKYNLKINNDYIICGIVSKIIEQFPNKYIMLADYVYADAFEYIYNPWRSIIQVVTKERIMKFNRSMNKELEIFPESHIVGTFDEMDPPSWLVGGRLGSTMDNRWFMYDHVYTLEVGESAFTDFQTITRIE